VITSGPLIEGGTVTSLAIPETASELEDIDYSSLTPEELSLVQSQLTPTNTDQKDFQKGLKKVTSVIRGIQREFVVAGWIPIYGHHYVYRITERKADGTKAHRYIAMVKPWEEAMTFAKRHVQTPYGWTKGRSCTVNLNRRAKLRDPRTMRLIPFDHLVMSPTYNQLGINVVKLAELLPDALVSGLIEVHGTAEASKYYQMWLQEKSRADDLETAYTNLERNTEKRAHVLAESMYRDFMMGVDAAISFAKATTLKANWYILVGLFSFGMLLGIGIDRLILMATTVG
jgi:hypothetical protein